MQQTKSPGSHYVPKVYLKKFVNRNGKLFRANKASKKQTRLKDFHPSAICYQPGFYEFSSKHPLKGYIVAEPNYLEDRGFLYENKLNKWIDKVISPTEVVSTQDAYDLAVTLFNLKVRNPFYREHSFSEQSINFSIDKILAEEKQSWNLGESVAQLRNVPYELFTQIVEHLRHEWINDPNFSKELHNRSLLENLENPSQIRLWVYYKLTAAKWVIYKTTINHQFICSDNPGYCIDEENKVHNIRFGGRCTFVFPLTSYHALAIIADDDDIKELPVVKPIQHIQATSDLVKIINQATWIVANKHVYAAYEQSILQTWYAMNGSGLII
ncbi:DUF4238 domain-containing protein [Spirosoma sp. KUDC1026]|uniref:DUF4238 domain-containing protein n=1 Tax=Spirosoma sp. KUDC1026 TaxID=2745947 RepID=UPI00159BDE2E|nr:DUF4238 domain-containing protein [Spirosoma sp. KUDC1026]QKZ13862.1 DUF4238 domain-containing protein [Spirosoma sp. KUDC1026]